MKVYHPTNRQRFGDVDPGQPLHFTRLTGSKRLGQDARVSHARSYCNRDAIILVANSSTNRR
jgi:hypothetical protein